METIQAREGEYSYWSTFGAPIAGVRSTGYEQASGGISLSVTFATRPVRILAILTASACIVAFKGRLIVQWRTPQ